MANNSNTIKTALLKDVDTMIGIPNNLDQQDDYEIEARIGMFRGQKFMSNVPSKNFYRVLDHFLEHTPDIYTYIRQEESIRTEDLIKTPAPTMPDIIDEYTFIVNDGGRYSQRIRESFVKIANVNTPRFYSTKRAVGTVDFVNYFTRFAISKENNLGVVIDPKKESSPIPSGAEPQSLRVKNRWSFSLTNQKDTDHPLYPYRVDLTHVTGWYVDNGKKTFVNTHEIELEVIYKPIKSSQKELWPGIYFMIGLVQNTNRPVTAQTMSNVIQNYNSYFPNEISRMESKMKKRNHYWQFNHDWTLFNPLNKPINLKLHDLEKSDLLAITDKADGERRLMYIRKDGAYLLYPPGEVMRFQSLSNPNDQKQKDQHYYIDPKEASELDGTIIDGELVLKDDGVKEFLAFDLIMDRGKNYMQMSFKDRIQRLKTIVEEHSINITVKTFYFPDSGNFYDRVVKALDSIEEKPYGNDGLILNNINDLYETAKIYKWKPPHQLTIDFEINNVTENVYKLYVKNDGQKGPALVQFLGTPKFPAQGVATLPTKIDKTPLTTGQIIEMAWDYANNTFVPTRIRHDRDQPNNFSVAKDVWMDIMDPILEDTIRGYNLKTMRRYHNVIKKDMLQKHCDGSIIVDLGTGRGGDLHKWKGLGAEILGVEPNEMHLTEFRSRLLESGYKQINDTFIHIDGTKKTTVTLIQGFGQETNKIVSAFQKTVGKSKSAHCVTMFNVLTFFFDKEGSLDSLVNTIDQLLGLDGYFMGLVMDGVRVRQLLAKQSLLKEQLQKLNDGEFWNLDTQAILNKKSLQNLAVSKKWRIVSKDKNLLKTIVQELDEADIATVKNHGWTITRTTPFTDSPYGNEIKIHLGEDTIVTEQIEYLVDFNELVKKLAAKNIVLQNTHFLLDNAMMSQSQQELNNLYRSFTFIRKNPGVSNPLIQDEPVQPVITRTPKVPVKSPGLKKPVKPIVESSQLISSHEFDTTLNFNAIENPIKHLESEQRAPINIRGVDFVRIGTIIGGVCVLSAILRAAYPTYILDQNTKNAPPLTDLQIASRENSVGKLMNRFIKDTKQPTQTVALFKSFYDKGEIPSLKQYESWSEARRLLSNCQNWTLLGLWESIAKVFKHNLVIITADSPFVSPVVYKTANVYPTTVVLYNHNGTVDTLGQQDANGNLITLFKKEDITINQL